MIIHLDSDNPKSLEQKIEELILKKLFVTVDESRVTINKKEYLDRLLANIVILANSDSVEDALELAFDVEPICKTNPEAKKIELTEVANNFEIEISAYEYFLNADEEESEYEIYDTCLSILNSNTELLELRLAELISISLTKKVSEEASKREGYNYEQALGIYANHVKLLASNDTIEEAAEEHYYSNEAYFIKYKITIDTIEKQYNNFMSLFKDEINAYKFALSLQSQNAEIPAILAMVKQLLKIEN